MGVSGTLNAITSKILPPGCDFFPQQKEVIRAEGSIDVVAGPGSGKTTVLIAKSGLILKKNYGSNKGMCLITHTNVAVDEIKKGLVKLGIKEVEYPNFIGTIQEFFNTFFSKKAFHLVLGEKKFRVLEDDEYQVEFEKLFNQRKPSWYTVSSPKVSKYNTELIINNDFSYTIESDAKNSYSSAFNSSIKALFSWGIVTNDQCLKLSNWYITKYKTQLKKAMLNRFEYVILDEAQDTNLLQFKMLNDLFNNAKISFQKFGDPYQALYNLFDDDEDAWIPTSESGVNYLEISETSRFGPSIANVVKNVCIEKYETFTSLNIIDSFKPHYIIYKNEIDLLEKYRTLIDYYKLKSKSFSDSLKKDAVLAPFHKELSSLFSVYTKPTTKKRNSQSPIRKKLYFFIDLLSKEIGEAFLDVWKKVESSLPCKIALSKCVLEIIKEDFNVELISSNLQEVLNNISDRENDAFLKVNLEDQIVYFRNILFSTDHHDNKSDFYIGTIHSAKGETHRSTLLLLGAESINYKNNKQYSMFELLTKYLVGEYADPQKIEDAFKRQETIKFLKLAYVALSRPTHLMVIAIPENLVDISITKQLDDSGWEAINCNYQTI